VQTLQENAKRFRRPRRPWLSRIARQDTSVDARRQDHVPDLLDRLCSVDGKAVHRAELHISAGFRQILNCLDIEVRSAKLRMSNNHAVETCGHAVIVYRENLVAADMTGSQNGAIVANQLDDPLRLIRENTIFGNRVELLILEDGDGRIGGGVLDGLKSSVIAWKP